MRIVHLLPGCFICLLLACVPPRSTSENPDMNNSAVTNQIKNLEEKGGRVSVSPDGKIIAYDKRGADGFIDIWTMSINGSNKQCLTCDHPILPTKHIGQPAWHPSGKYIVVQAEKQEHPEGIATPLSVLPGAGVFNDLWMIEYQTDREWLIHEVPNSKQNGVLHPQFSFDGKKISWSELYKGAKIFNEAKLAGSWKLKIADVQIANDGTVSIRNLQTFQPGDEVIYENHGFSPDGAKLIFSSNLKNDQSIHSSDIYTLDVQTQQLTALTDTGYNEHAHYSPDGTKIIWMSTNGNIEPSKVDRISFTDWWIMNSDGTDKKRLTYLNKKGHPHFVFWGTCAADLDWLPNGKGFIGYYFTFSVLNFKEVVISMQLD